jgi:AmiR/NasT family two-component response regulator
MTDSATSSQLWPEDLIEEATGIIMIAFDLDAAQALRVLRRMSRNTGVQMCMVAEQIINRKVPVEALRGVEEDVLGFG